MPERRDALKQLLQGVVIDAQLFADRLFCEYFQRILYCVFRAAVPQGKADLVIRSFIQRDPQAFLIVIPFMQVTAFQRDKMVWMRQPGMSAQPVECFTDCFVRTFPQRIVSLKIHKPADTRLPFMLFRKLFGFPESFLFRKVHDVLPGIRSPEIVVCDMPFVHSGFTRQYPLVSRASRPSPTMFRRMVQKSSWKSAMIMFTSRSV